MRVFVTGWKGLLGAALVPRLAATHTVTGMDLEDGDIADRKRMRELITGSRPEVVVHLAAMTAVDRCEAEPEEAFRVNAEGTRVVAAEAESLGARMITLSTDYVFDGQRHEPYRETEPPNPLSVYGRSKRAGEEAALAANTRCAVVRSAWLYGAGGGNFVDTMIDLVRTRDRVAVVSDQVGSPTYAEDLAGALVRLCEGEAHGVFHLANGGKASWFDLARAAAAQWGLDPGRVVEATTREIARPAPRPPFSVLDCGRAREELGVELPPWRDALTRYLEARRTEEG